MARPRLVSDKQIDAAARATFIEHGPRAPVALVAEKLGVTHAALLRRAGSKERLLLRALSPGVPAVAEALREAPPERAPSARLLELLGELLSFHERMLPGMMVLRTAGVPVGLPRGLDPPPLMFRRLLSQWLTRTGLISRDRAPALADALLGAVEARCFNGYLGGGAYTQGAPDEFVRKLVAGVLPELSRRR